MKSFKDKLQDLAGQLNQTQKSIAAVMDHEPNDDDLMSSSLIAETQHIVNALSMTLVLYAAPIETEVNIENRVQSPRKFDA